MIVRMSEAAGRRRREEALLQAQVIAAGTAAGVYGKSEPIEALARALGLPYPTSAAAGAPGGEVRDIIAKLNAATRGA